MEMLRIADIVDDSIVDGPGLRMTIFVQGCLHNCPGCHNPQTHDPAGGSLWPIDRILQRYMENPLLSGLTFSGGEPFLQPGPLAALAAKAHKLGADIVVYSGYTFEELAFGSMAARPGVSELLAETDLLVDGPYIEELRSLELQFRGSSNQRILDRAARSAILRQHAEN